MTDSMISRCHCHITAILPQKRKDGRAGGPSRWAQMMVSHHLPLVGIELLGHQRVRDRHWRTSERGAYSFPALGHYSPNPTTAPPMSTDWCPLMGATSGVTNSRRAACATHLGKVLD